MKKDKIKIFSLDDDHVEVCYIYNEDCDRHIGNYPDFSENPRYTPNGKPWVNVISEDCPYCEGKYGDCGSCPYLMKAHEKDMIGICNHELKRNHFKRTEKEGENLWLEKF